MEAEAHPNELLEKEAAVVRLGREMLREGPRGVVLFERAVSKVRGEPMALSLDPIGAIPPPLEEPGTPDESLKNLLP